MGDLRDRVSIPGIEDQSPATSFRRGNQTNEAHGVGPQRQFLAVWFKCCHAYGRMYRNPESTQYRGACPNCGAKVRAMIGPNGTSQRMFVAE